MNRYLNLILNIVHSLIIIYILIILLVTPFFLSNTIQSHISFLDTEDSKNQYFTEEEISDSRINLIDFYKYNADLNIQYFSQEEISHYNDVKYLLMLNLIIATILLIYILGIILLIVFKIKNFNILITNLNFIKFLSLLLIPIILVFEFFWVKVFHPLLFPQGGFAILRPEYVSYYLFSHEFFLIIVAIIILSILIIISILKLIIQKLLIHNLLE